MILIALVTWALPQIFTCVQTGHIDIGNTFRVDYRPQPRRIADAVALVLSPYAPLA